MFAKLSLLFVVLLSLSFLVAAQWEDDCGCLPNECCWAGHCAEEFCVDFKKRSSPFKFPVYKATEKFQGEGSFFTPALGACGFNNTAEDLVVALNGPQFDRNTICKRQAIVSGPKGKVQVTVVDKCPECKFGDLVLSPSAFTLIAGDIIAAGRVNISWYWL